eukprot:1160997-Rhodomonas_salina.1
MNVRCTTAVQQSELVDTTGRFVRDVHFVHSQHHRAMVDVVVSFSALVLHLATLAAILIVR